MSRQYVTTLSEFLNENHDYNEFLLEPSRFGYNDSPVRDIFSLRENIMAKFSKWEILSMFGINESSISDEEAIITNGIYELGLLSRNRKDWFKDNTPISIMESVEDSKVVLFKNSQYFIISKETYDNIGLIREGVSDIFKWAGNKIVDVAKGVWDALSSGAKVVGEFLAKIGKAVEHFVHDNHDLFTALTYGLMIVAGVAPLVPALGSLVGPIAMSLAGGIHILEGIAKITEGSEKLKDFKIPLVAKNLAIVQTALPNLLAGGVYTLLGAKDIITSVASAIPGVGFVSGATKKVAQAGADKLAGTLVGKSAKGLEHLVKHAVEGPLKTMLPKIGKGLATGIGESAVAFSVGMISVVGERLLNSIFTTILSGISGLSKGVEFMLELPQKLDDMLEKLIASGAVGKIIGNALKYSFIGLMNKLLATFLNKYVTPKLKPFLLLLQQLPAFHKEAVKIIQSDKIGEGHGEIKVETHHSEKVGDVKLEGDDKENLKKLAHASADQNHGEKKGGSNKNEDPFKFFASLKDKLPEWKGVTGDTNREVTIEFLGFADGKGAKKYKTTLKDYLNRFKDENDKYYGKGKAEIVYGEGKTDIHKGGGYIVVKDKKLKLKSKPVKESYVIPYFEEYAMI